MTDMPSELVDKLLKDFYLSTSFEPKAERNADTVRAAIQFTIAALTDHQSAGEPVAWMYDSGGFKTLEVRVDRREVVPRGYTETPLYAAPQTAPTCKPSLQVAPSGEVRDEFIAEALRLLGLTHAEFYEADYVAKLAATLQKLAEVEDKLDRIAYKDRDLSSGLSWDGHVICGDAKAIDAVKKALHYSSQIDEYRKGFVERTDALTAKLGEEREARLISETCAVKTQEMLMEVLDVEKAKLAEVEASRRSIAHRAYGIIDALLLYATCCPNDSHAEEGMGFAMQLRKALGIKTLPRVHGQIKPLEQFQPVPDLAQIGEVG